MASTDGRASGPSVDGVHKLRASGRSPPWALAAQSHKPNTYKLKVAYSIVVPIIVRGVRSICIVPVPQRNDTSTIEENDYGNTAASRKTRTP